MLDAFKKEETHPKKTFLDKALARMICQDLQPVSLVEDPGFRKFSSALDSKYQQTCQKPLRTVMLPNLLEVCQEKVKKDLANTNDMCITTDLWTSLNASSFINITAHYWRERDLKVVSKTLDCLPMSDWHTRANIALAVDKVLKEFGIQQKVLTAATDNGSNMAKGMSTLNVSHISY